VLLLGLIAGLLGGILALFGASSRPRKSPLPDRPAILEPVDGGPA
jgi:hypothetical protein